MRNTSPSFFIFSLGLCCLTSAFAAENTPSPESPPKAISSTPFEPFTGKITKNKVRLRLQPTFDGQVIRELNRNDLVVVLGETDDFYAIKPPADIHAYVFRTFVLDNVIEGNRVNVRLKPELEAPVLAQLNSGDRVEGSIDATNNKWLEIKLPTTTRFYMAKDYIEKAGDAGLMARLEKKHEEVYRLLNTTESISKTELQKPFKQINIEGIKANYQHIIFDFPEFPEASLKAKELLATLQETYAAKKLAYLETQAQASSSVLENKTKQLNEELQAHKTKISRLEQQLESNNSVVVNSFPPKPNQLPIQMAAWVPKEEEIFGRWAQQTGNSDPNAFYQDQKQQSFKITGIIDPYNRPVKNKPGDYMLISSVTKLPIAYLYSTQINLQDYVGHEVTLSVTSRPNNNYAFPAYFVLSLE